MGIRRIVYGDKEITNDKAYRLAWEQIYNRAEFYICNENLGEDPKQGVEKFVTIDYCNQDKGPVKRRESKEGSIIDFKWDINYVEYGGHRYIEEPEIMEKFLYRLQERETIDICNDFFFNRDPAQGVTKKAKIEVNYPVSGGGFSAWTWEVDEGDSVKLWNSPSKQGKEIIDWDNHYISP